MDEWMNGAQRDVVMELNEEIKMDDELCFSF